MVYFAGDCLGRVSCNDVAETTMTSTRELDTIQDFLIKLGIKPSLHMYIENKHFFTKSGHRQTYQNYAEPSQSLQNSYFQSHFLASKINLIFLFFFPVKNISLGDQLL